MTISSGLLIFLKLASPVSSERHLDVALRAIRDHRTALGVPRAQRSPEPRAQSGQSGLDKPELKSGPTSMLWE